LGRIVNALLAAALCIGSVVAWPRLPALVPIHFDLAGHPDHWVRASATSWFALPVLALGLSLFLHWTGTMVARHPEWINVPNKKAYEALPPEGKQAVARVVAGFCGWIGALVTLVFGTIQLHAYRSAMGLYDGGWFNVVQLASVVVAVLMLVGFAVRLTREVRRQAAG
jgi:uncharacterized membrane protein